MNATSSVAGPEADQRGPIPARTILNGVAVVVGVPLAWSFMAGLWFIQDYDPLYLLADHYNVEKWLFWVGLLVGAALVGFDVVLAKYDDEFKEELYNTLKEMGEHVKGGMAVEAAVQKTCGWKKTPVAKAFNRALKLSEGIPFDTALEKVAAESGQRSFQEIAGLVSMSISTGGDVGPSLRWLGGHFTVMRQNEMRFTGAIESSLTVMRGVGLLAAPFMYNHLQSALDRKNEVVGPLDPMTVAFFVYGAIGMGCLDGIVYDRWTRVPAKIPLYIGLVRLCLGYW